MRYLILAFCLACFVGCDQVNPPEDIEDPASPNILLIIADDMGKDATSGFSEGIIKPNTPNLDNIRNGGLSFNNLWVNPTCSPTRASIITGKFGYRTGVKWANDELDPSETILQKYIRSETNDAYATAVIGKWHLSGESTTANPEAFGLDYYAGLVRGAVQDYYQWQLTEDGSGSLQTEYISTVLTDLSVDWVTTQSKPWFLWLAYNAPHTPFHVPPVEMHSQGNLPDYSTGLDPIPYYMAAIEAMDHQIGELLTEIPQEVLDNTIIIFIGDNGTPNQVTQSPFSSNTAKGSMYQGGINVPMFISGKGVNRTGQDNSLICSTDIFSTIADLAGVKESDIHDSKSFKGLFSEASSHREFQYSEMNNGTDDLWAISNGKFKLIIGENGSQEMYDLSIDPYEGKDLLLDSLDSEAEIAKENLQGELLTIRN